MTLENHINSVFMKFKGHIFILYKASSVGTQYGIGTYIKEITESLLDFAEYKITLVSYKSTGCKELYMNTRSTRFRCIDIPGILFSTRWNLGLEAKYASMMVKILSDYIPTNEKVIFLLNFVEELHLAIALKNKYNLFPIINVVHFAQFQQLFNGNKKRIIGLNINNPSSETEFTLSIEKKFYEVTDHIISVTKYMKDFLVTVYKIDPKKITVIPNGVNCKIYNAVSKKERSRIRHKLGFREDETLILFSGRIDFSKGVDLLINAFERASKCKDALRLILMGNGNLPEFQSILRSNYGKVTFPGYLQKEQVNLFYKIADIGIVPSIYDHCPYTVLEMMSYKIPLIMSRIDGLNEMLEDSDCLFIEPHIDFNGEIILDPSLLSELIILLSNNKCLRKKLSESAYKKLKTKFSASTMSKSMSNLFATLKNV